MSPFFHYGHIAPQRVALEINNSNLPTEDKDAYLEEMAARIPLNRIGQAADTAAMCAFLASDDASFITGEAINVSGGEEMH